MCQIVAAFGGKISESLAGKCHIMTFGFRVLTFAIVLSFGLVTVAFAQQFYSGASFDAELDVDAESYPGSMVALAGVRLPLTSSFFVAGQAEMHVGSAGHDAEEVLLFGEEYRRRYMAILGADWQNLSVFVGTGSGILDYSTSNSESGYSLNVGFDLGVTENLTVRFEALREGYSDFGSTDVSLVDSVRVGTIFNF